MRQRERENERERDKERDVYNHSFPEREITLVIERYIKLIKTWKCNENKFPSEAESLRWGKILLVVLKEVTLTSDERTYTPSPLLAAWAWLARLAGAPLLVVLCWYFVCILGTTGEKSNYGILKK